MENAAQSVANSARFRPLKWSAWAPGLATADDWAKWLDGDRRFAESGTPSMDFMPPMQRRRLGPLARMGFRVLEDCLDEGQPPLPLVFASRHGDLKRSYDLLSDMARREPLSPRDFSLSVHNATLGLYSIFRGNTSPSSAVAAGVDSLPAGLLEASVQAAESDQECLLVWVEDRIPDFYYRWLPEGTPVAGLAIRLAPASDPSAWHLSWQSASVADTLASEVDVLAAFLALMLERSSRVEWVGDRKRWCLERPDVAV